MLPFIYLEINSFTTDEPLETQEDLINEYKSKKAGPNGDSNSGPRQPECRIIHRARSLRNLLVSGNECGRVFPAGVGPGSPSRDAANWLPSRFSLSVETRRRYGWLRMMVFPGARLFPSPNLVPFGRVAARERQGALSRRAW